MKKLFALALAALMVLSLAACGKKAVLAVCRRPQRKPPPPLPRLLPPKLPKPPPRKAP